MVSSCPSLVPIQTPAVPVRTRTDPTLKWLLNERAALAGAQQSTLEAIPRLQHRVHRVQALFEKARHSLAVAEKALELNSAKLQALDITLAQFNPQVIMEHHLDCAAAVELARQAYRLSPTEAALLRALMRGHTPQDFADARGSRISTVRTQRSALFAKTSTLRQQDLIALVARLMLLTPAQVQAVD